jgi:hypothetical protein
MPVWLQIVLPIFTALFGAATALFFAATRPEAGSQAGRAGRQGREDAQIQDHS